MNRKLRRIHFYNDNNYNVYYISIETSVSLPSPIKKKKKLSNRRHPTRRACRGAAEYERT